MILLDEMAVRFTTSGEAELMNAVSQINRGMLQLKTTMETASRTLVDQFGNVVRSSQAAAAATAQNTAATEKMAASASASGAKMQQFAITAAFALSAMASGSDTAFMKITKGIAVLGFAFGPVTGAITTFVAIAGEQLIRWFNRAAEAAEKTKAAADKTFASLARGNDLITTATAANRLREGDPLAAIGKDAEEFGEALRLGGKEGLERRIAQLTKELAGTRQSSDMEIQAARATLRTTLNSDKEAVRTNTAELQQLIALRDRRAEINVQLNQATALLAPLAEQLGKLDTLANEQARRQSTSEGVTFARQQAEDAAKRRGEIATIGFAREESAAQAHYATAAALADKDTAAQLAALRARTAEELRISDQRAAAIKRSATGTMTASGIVGVDPDWSVRLAQENARRADLVQKGQADERAIRAKGMEESKAQLIDAHASAMAATKGNLEAQLFLNAGYFDILAELYPDDVALWRTAEDEKTRILQEQVTARLRIADTAAASALASGQAAAQRQYAVMTQAANGDTARQLSASKRLQDEELRLSDERIKAIKASGAAIVDRDAGWELKLAQEMARRSGIIQTAADRDNAILLAKASQVQQESEHLAAMASGAFASLMESGGGIKSFADFVMKQMGQMFIRIGEGWVASAAIFKAAAAAITAFSGGGALFAGLAMIALGSALSSGSGGAFSGGGGGGYSAPDSPRTYHGYASINPAAGRGPSMAGRTEFAPITPATTPLRSMTDGGRGPSMAGRDYATMTPTTNPTRAMTDGVTMPGARESITVNATIIGTNDPRAQREIGELIKKGRARGEIPG